MTDTMLFLFFAVLPTIWLYGKIIHAATQKAEVRVRRK